MVIVALCSAGCITSGSSQTVHPQVRGSSAVNYQVVDLRPSGGIYSGICSRAALRFNAHAATLEDDPILQQHFVSLSLLYQGRADAPALSMEEKYSSQFRRYKDNLRLVFGEHGDEIFDATVVV